MLTLEQMIEAVRKWREDVKDGTYEPKERYPEVDPIPFNFFDPVCDTLNAEWEAKGSGLRVRYGMGDFRATYKRQMELL